MITRIRKNIPLRMVLLLLFGITATVPHNGFAGDRVNTISLGASTVNKIAFITSVSYERLIYRDSLSLYASLGHTDYRYTNNFYLEKAKGPSAEIGFRAYPRGSNVGWHLGAGFGFRELSGYWRDDIGTPFETTGRGHVVARDLYFQLGRTIKINNTPWKIDPSFSLGILGSSPSEFGPQVAYVGIGIALGVGW